MQAKQKKIQLNLSASEKQKLKIQKIGLQSLTDYAVDELESLLSASSKRAREIYALIQFQSIPSLGIKFAEDLIFLGYYSINELQKENGARLTDSYELKKGYCVDPCVEDQFRLVVYYANTKDKTKNWWDFTAERKKYRNENGYPKNRPKKSQV